jgi:hypothetical protein
MPTTYLQHAAQIYIQQNRLPPIIQGIYAPCDEAVGKAIANAYEALPLYDLSNIEVCIAYTQFAVEVCDQFTFLTKTLGISIELWQNPGQPYNNSAEMFADVAKNMHLYVFAGGTDHALLGYAESARPWSINVKFRAVHDLFGHAAEGYQFGPRGEENAWLAHSQMFSPLAQKALTTETRGQNAWFNFGRHNYGQDGKRRALSPAQKPFAVQKIALLPDEFTNWQVVLTAYLADQQSRGRAA